METIRSSETSVQSTTSTLRHTPEDGIFHSHRRENLKSYKQYINFIKKGNILHQNYEKCGEMGVSGSNSSFLEYQKKNGLRWRKCNDGKTFPTERTLWQN
jgi:hypothetical protein